MVGLQDRGIAVSSKDRRRKIFREQWLPAFVRFWERAIWSESVRDAGSLIMGQLKEELGIISLVLTCDTITANAAGPLDSYAIAGRLLLKRKVK